mmetsp:Transcript_56421/g.85318  ORF Transcript_56421/g.85318 Transcript_56421/m.85318 type:complete len:319 (-) Transcript_56421:62-1018(-)
MMIRQQPRTMTFRSTRLLATFLTLILLNSFAVVVVTAQTCQPCFGGIEASSDDDDCADLVRTSLSLRAGTTECSASQLENFQSACCSQSPRGFCTLCPDGGAFDAGRIVPNLDPEAGDITCADLNVDDNYLDYLFQPGVCFDTFKQRSAAWCGCNRVERECSLCPDGSRPPMPGLVDPVYYNWSCDAFDYVSSYFSVDECATLATDIFEFDAAAYCGCPGVPMPNICDLCPEGQEVIHPDQKLGSGSFTCRELALSTWYIPAEGPCDKVKEGYTDKGFVDECCGVPNYKLSDSGSSNTVSQPMSFVILAMAAMVSQTY